MEGGGRGCAGKENGREGKNMGGARGCAGKKNGREGKNILGKDWYEMIEKDEFHTVKKLF